LKERNYGRVVAPQELLATLTAHETGRNSKIINYPPVEDGFFNQLQIRPNRISSIRGETRVRVANPAQSACLASGLKAALLHTSINLSMRVSHLNLHLAADKSATELQVGTSERHVASGETA